MTSPVSVTPRHIAAIRGALCCLALALAGCQMPSRASPPAPVSSESAVPNAPIERVLARITWGLDSASYQHAQAIGLQRYLDEQLHPGPAVLPPSVQREIDAMPISRTPLEQLAREMAERRKAVNAIADDAEKNAARREYQQQLNRLAQQAATRFLLRVLYSPNQLQEQMTWFWMNHFNVFQGKDGLRAAIGDYEEHAIRPHALGKFRDLLAATVHHPAMLRYLDNAQNAVHHLNENYARELMELHTLGVNGGYSQQDVQELARILTGLGIRLDEREPRVRRGLQDQYVRQGLFEFNPNRHDYGDKRFLGKTIRGRGLAEVDEAIDRLSRHPATARFISAKLAAYFVGDKPPPALVERMAATFRRSDGDIAAVLATLFHSPEFAQSLGHEFKDPVHYVLSSVRLAYDGKPIQPISNALPIVNWLRRMGEPLYGRQTPDGYPLDAAAWNSPGQMTTRFEIARVIGSGNAGLFRAEGAHADERPAFPQLANALYYRAIQPSLGAATRHALDQATSPQEWNVFLLASPEWMVR